MRVISQGRLIDFPYEDTILRIRPQAHTGYYELVAYANSYWTVIGKYTTEDKALQALMDLQIAYSHGSKIYYLPEIEECLDV